jgi:hypothetical protein
LYLKIHEQFKQSTPNQSGLYKLSLPLQKIFNTPNRNIDWLNFANQIAITGRQTKFKIIKTNKTKIGLNTLSNRFYCLSKQINLTSLNLTFFAFKIK